MLKYLYLIAKHLHKLLDKSTNTVLNCSFDMKNVYFDIRNVSYG